MPRKACFVLLALCPLRPPSAAADLCQYVAFTGLPEGDVVVVDACLPFDGPTQCVVVRPTTGLGGVEVVLCYPLP